MLRAALRDLQWRRRRVVITVVGTALVFAMSLLMSGLSSAFSLEVDRTLADQRAEGWVTPAGLAGPFSAGFAVTPAIVAAVADAPGVATADPVVFARATVDLDGIVDVNVFGVREGGLGTPVDAAEGEPSPRRGGIVVPQSIGRGVGDEVDITGTTFEVVGTVDKASLFAGMPSIFMTIEDAQDLLLGGQPLASMVLTEGVPSSEVAGVEVFDRAAARSDLLRPLVGARQSIDIVRLLLWLVAALIVASVVYLTALERSRDIAVFKATGVSTWSIGVGICVQAIVIALAAALVGAVLALFLAPRFPLDVVISARSLLVLPLLAVGVGIAAGMIGVRRTTSVEPASAFGGP